MTLTLLLDLDDTLLENQIDSFVPAYVGALGSSLSAYIQPQKMARQLLAATQEMIQNLLPDHTLEQVFDAHFYPALGLEKARLQDPIAEFYREKFPSLRPLTRPRPEAIALIEWALSQGHRLAVATNPIFPLTAILQRLSWAELPPERYPFAIVPGFESFHFAKPSPAYYTELLAQMGWPQGPIVMVGDDLLNDIQAGREAGLATFWLQNQSPATPPPGVPYGGFSELRAWLENTPAEQLQPSFKSRSAMLAVLRSTPAALDTFSRQATPQQMAHHPDADAWCATEILCHFRDVEIEVNLPRLAQFQDEENPFLAVRNTDDWVAERGYHDQNPQSALAIFSQQRSRLIAALEAMPLSGWERSARHAIFGPTRLDELVSIVAEHDRLHIRQFLQALQSTPAGTHTVLR